MQSPRTTACSFILKRTVPTIFEVRVINLAPALAAVAGEIELTEAVVEAQAERALSGSKVIFLDKSWALEAVREAKIPAERLVND